MDPYKAVEGGCQKPLPVDGNRLPVEYLAASSLCMSKGLRKELLGSAAGIIIIGISPIPLNPQICYVYTFLTRF